MLTNLMKEIKNVDNFGKKLESETNDYKDSILYTKSLTNLTGTEEDLTLKVYKKYVLEESKPEQLGSQPPPESAMEAYNQSRKKAIFVPRLLSIASYQSLFDQALENS